MPTPSRLPASALALTLGLSIGVAACGVVDDDLEKTDTAQSTTCPDAEDAPPAPLDAAVGRWAATAKTELGGADADQKALARLDAMIGEATLIALGEPDHGFHEFAQLRNELFEYLVVRRDLRALTLETGIVEAHLVDRYVTDVAGTRGITIDDVLANGFTHDMGEWQETKDLVAWVKQHNVEAAAAGKPVIHWGGKDLSVRGDTLTAPLKDLEAFYGKVGADGFHSLDALAKKASAVTDLVEQTLLEVKNQPHIDPDFLDAVTSLSYDQLTDDEQNEVGDEIHGLESELERSGSDWTAKSSADEVDWARQLLVVERQIFDDLETRKKANVVYGPTNSAGFTLDFLQKVYAAIGKPIPPMRHGQLVSRDYTPEELANYAAARGIREQHLAENVESLVTRYGRTFNFAANSQLDKAKGLADSGSGVAEGNFLLTQYEKGYVFIAATASDFVDVDPAIAQIRATERARAGSLESALEKAGTTKPFVLRIAQEDACDRPTFVTSFFDSPQLTWIGPAKFQIVPAKSYDAIVWFQKATPGQRIGPAQPE